MYSDDPDVVVIGGGPNGLTAAAMIAGAGLHVLLLETASEVGGAVRSGEATLPGFQHDLFSGFYPLARVGPVSALPLERYGVEWCTFARPYGGATPGGVGFALEQTPAGTGRALALRSPADLAGWNELWGTWLRFGHPLLDLLFSPLGTLGPVLKLGLRVGSPSGLWAFLRFVLAPSRTLADQLLASEDARVWFIGSALHSDLAPEAAGSGVYSLVLLGLAQEVGMPIPRGGAQRLSDALRACIEDRGGIVKTGTPARGLVIRGGRVSAVSTPSGEVRARRAVLATAATAIPGACAGRTSRLALRPGCPSV
jgi:phytoene dehydrogenase-like protein